MRYLLDSNIVSEPLRPVPSSGIIRSLQIHDGEAAISAPVWHELCFGCARLAPSHRRDMIDRYIHDVVLASFPVLDYDCEAAEWHALERARLEFIGKTPPFVDGQIAAIAVVNKFVLVTSNVRDFEKFKGQEVLSWT